MAQVNNKYENFMYDMSNAYCCSECPLNPDDKVGDNGQYPCGQYRCWVYCYCSQAEQ